VVLTALPPHAWRLFVWLAGVDRVGLPRAQRGGLAVAARPASGALPRDPAWAGAGGGDAGRAGLWHPLRRCGPAGPTPGPCPPAPVPAGDHGPMRPRRISVVRQGWNWQWRRRSPACMAASTSPSTTTAGSPSGSASDRRSTNACASGTRTTSRAVLDHRNSWR
jgi:hypothetical protein